MGEKATLKEQQAGAEKLFSLYKKEKAFYQQRDQEHEAFAKKLAKDVRVLRIPEVTEPISDLQGLIRMAEILKEKGDSK